MSKYLIELEHDYLYDGTPVYHWRVYDPTIQVKLAYGTFKKSDPGKLTESGAIAAATRALIKCLKEEETET